MILVIDNYDSFTYNLVHLIGTFTDNIKVIRNDVMPAQDAVNLRPTGIVISPGPGRPADAGITKEVISLAAVKQVPLLGVCLGHQAIGEVFGGEVTYAPTLMHGKTSTIKHDGRTLFKGVANGFTATRYHSLVIAPESLPEVLEISATTPDGIIMGLRHRQLPIEGIQFHPESVLTKTGPELIRNWLTSIRIVTSQDIVVPPPIHLT